MKYKIKQVTRYYENSIGEPVKLVGFIGKVKKFYLAKPDGTKITPIFDSIRLDKENDAFLVTTKIHDVYEDGRPSTRTDTISFYIDFSGNPISLGYVEYLDEYYPVKLSDENVTYDNQWFQEFGVTLRNIGIEFGKELDRRRKQRRKIKKLIVK